MKINKLLVLACAALTYMSCTKDNKDVEITPPDETGVGTYAKISLTQLAQGTSRAAPGTAAILTTDESEVQSATVFVFNANKILEKKQNLTVNGTNTGADEVFEITTGKKYVYATVNIPEAQLNSFTEGMTSLTAFEEKLINVTSVAPLTTSSSTGYWMTNVAEPSAVTLVEATQSEAASEVKNDITIEVGRAVAKVNVDFLPEQQLGGVLTDVHYKVMQNPNQMYLMPIYNGGSVLYTPFFNDATVTGSKYFNNTSYLATGTFGNQGPNPDYMIENTNAVPKEGNATHLAIQGTFIPTTVYDENGENPRAGVEGDDFWRVVLPDGSYGDKYYYEEPTQNQMLAEKGTEVAKYTDGKSYYALWVAITSETNTVAKYTVKRNNYYWVTIISVNGAGDNDEDNLIPDPEIPLDKTTYMKAIIDVLDWNLIEQHAGI